MPRQRQNGLVHREKGHPGACGEVGLAGDREARDTGRAVRDRGGGEECQKRGRRVSRAALSYHVHPWVNGVVHLCPLCRRLAWWARHVARDHAATARDAHSAQGHAVSLGRGEDKSEEAWPGLRWHTHSPLSTTRSQVIPAASHTDNAASAEPTTMRLGATGNSVGRWWVTLGQRPLAAAAPGDGARSNACTHPPRGGTCRHEQAAVCACSWWGE